MKKIYISLPITGHEDTAKQKAEEFKALLQKHLPDCDIKTPFDVCSEEGKPYGYYLGRDIEYILTCDYVFFMNGWEHSKGCQIERAVVDVYCIQRKFQMATEFNLKHNEPIL